MRYALDLRTLSSRFPGIGRYAGNLARALASELAAGERLLLLRDPHSRPHWENEIPAADGVEWLEAPVSPSSLRQQWLLPRLLREAGASLYHSPYYLMPYRVGVPTVVTVYDLIPERYPKSVSLAARFGFRAATRLALSAASHVITPSEATRRDLLRSHRLEPERVTAIALAPSPGLGPATESEQRRVREALGLPETYVLYLGTARPHKNLEGLLSAWALVEEERGEQTALVLAGAFAPDLVPEASRRLRSVKILGEVRQADLAPLLSGATLFVFPSLYEGFGLPVIEAMACGAPVLCSESGSLAEVTADAALHFDPADPVKIAGTIARALAEPETRAELSRRGLLRARLFSWRRAAAGTLRVYRSKLEARAS